MLGLYTYKIISRGKKIKSGLLFAANGDDAWVKTSLKVSRKNLLKYGHVTGTARRLFSA